MGLSRVSRTKALDGIIPAGGSLDLDVIDFDDFGSVKYLLRFTNPGKTKTMALNAFGTRQGSDVEDTIYGKIGDQINISLNLVVDGTDVVLRLSTIESFNVEVSGLKNQF